MSPMQTDLSRFALTAATVAVLTMGGCSKSTDVGTNPVQPATSPATTATAASNASTGNGDKPVVSDVAARSASPADHADSGIAWKHASSDADVDAAFSQAKAEAKPVFLYWGATWCPPCNQVKATIFNRQDFIERSRAFVPVYVDGDSPGAQKLGARFKVSGYPTMLLFSPNGTELTRLPGEVEAERYTQVLTLGMDARRPVKQVLAQALGDAKPGDAKPTATVPTVAKPTDGEGLTPNEWRLLAFYSWDTDEQQLVPRGAMPALLKRLADACPADQTETAARLRLKALAAVDEKSPAKPDAATQSMLTSLLADAPAARAQMDMLTNFAPEIVRASSTKGSPQRAELLAAFDVSLKRLEADTTLSRADRLTALIAQVDLAQIDVPKPKPGVAAKVPQVKPALPPALLADIREQVAKADREITDGYERQSVITTAADLLQEAGLGDESDSLLKSSLVKSHSPYYLMSELAGNAKARGDTAEALHWYEQAFEKSEGPATRLQWGASYVGALVELAPQDDGRIEKAASQLLTEAGALPDAFYERSGRSLQRVGTKLQAWNETGTHAPTMKRLQAQLDGVCGALGAGDTHRVDCEALLKTTPKKRA